MSRLLKTIQEAHKYAGLDEFYAEQKEKREALGTDEIVETCAICNWDIPESETVEYEGELICQDCKKYEVDDERSREQGAAGGGIQEVG